MTGVFSSDESARDATVTSTTSMIHPLAEVGKVHTLYQKVFNILTAK